MTIILNDGSLVNYDHIAMISRDVSCKDFGKCRCNIIKLTLLSDDLPRYIIAEEAEGSVIRNVLSQISDAIISGKLVVDLRTMGLTDGDKLAELKQGLEQAYRELEECPLFCKRINFIVQSIQEKKEAIAKVFHMSMDSTEKFVKSDEQYIRYKVEKMEFERKRMQSMYAAECEDNMLVKEMVRRGYKVKKGGK